MDGADLEVVDGLACALPAAGAPVAITGGAG